MSVKSGIRFPGTLTGRLALAYILITTLFSTIIVIAVGYFLFDGLNEAYDEILDYYTGETQKLFMNRTVDELNVFLQTEEYENESASGFIQVYSKTGKRIAHSDLRLWQHVNVDHKRLSTMTPGEKIFLTIENEAPGKDVRILYWKTPEENTVVMGITAPDSSFVFNIIKQLSIIVIVMMVIGSIGIGVLLSRMATSGIKKVINTAVNIGNGNFSARVPTGHQTEEIEALSQTFNLMVDKIERSVSELKNVSNSVAHDLRSPLTRIRGNVEVTLRGPDDIGEYQSMAETVIEECGRLEAMINTMLEIAAMDSGIEIMSKTRFNFCDIIDDAEDLFGALAESKGQQLTIHTMNRPLFIMADRHKLQRSIANLLDNAIKFTPQKGHIELSTQLKNRGIAITISDSGMGIPESDRTKIFDAFYRGDKARSETGNGLGLSYVKSIVRYHNGTIGVTDNPAGGGCFEIWIPEA